MLIDADQPPPLTLPRAMLTDPFFRRNRGFGEREAFIWLIAACAVRPGPGVFGGLVERGQIALGERDLARQWGWSPRRLDQFLHRLDAAGLIAYRAPIVEIVGIDDMLLPADQELPRAGIELLSATELHQIGVPDLTRDRSGVPLAVRRAVEARDGRRCRYCATESGPFHLDHVLPWSRGGRCTVDNLVVACVSCNLSKGARTPAEWKASMA